MLKVRGYAAVFGNVDSYNETIDEGAFTDWIAENPDKQIPIFWEHDHIFSCEPATPIGRTDMLREDRHGLYYEGELSDTPKAQEIATLLEDGAIKGASFAFKTLDDYRDDDGVRHLAKLTITEVSPVNWGANPKAYIEAIPEGAEGE